jgi:hypothetical protein
VGKSGEIRLAVQEITGTVKDGKGEAIPGANILLKGTGVGTSTSAEGTFSINVPDGNAVLVISSIGYVTKEVTVGNQKAVDVVLVDDANQLGEVVVTALGIQRDKKALTYATQQVGGQELLKSCQYQLCGCT